jgi:acetolactate synthase-1/2/3 large subunit
LETIRRLQLPIKLFVLNNDGYASIRASQKAYFGESRLGADCSNGVTIPSLTRVGEAFGLGATTIANQEDLRADVRRVLQMKGPVVCDVMVLPDEVRAPRLQSYQKPDGSFVSKPLEDLFPFLPRDEFFANMIVQPLPE